VASTFDVNADGFDDFVVGAPGYDGPYGTNQGRAYVFGVGIYGVLQILNNATMTNPTPGVSQYTPTPQDRFGQSVIGRVNPPPTIPTARKRPQIVVGAPGADLAGEGNRGVAFLYAITNASGPVERLDRILSNQADPERSPGDRFAVSLANLGPVPVSAPGTQHAVLVGAPFVDALDDAGRLIRRKGRSYAFRFIDRTIIIEPEQ
jgi:hypothetical protein